MTDILLSDSNDLAIRLGDFDLGQSDAQHLALLAGSHPGEWRQWPLLGIGIDTFLQEDASQADLKHRIAVQAEYDGAKITSITIAENSFEIKGYYP